MPRASDHGGRGDNGCPTRRQKTTRPRKNRGLVVEAPGIEADSCQREITIEHQLGSISTDANSADVSDRAPKCAIARGVVTQSSEAYELSNVVETALARALVLAAEAKRWDVVAQIADELGRRRPGQTGEQGTYRTANTARTSIRRL